MPRTLKKLHLHIDKENLIYLILWLTLFLAPVGSLYIRAQQQPDVMFRWHDIFVVWRVDVAFLGAFLLHNYLLSQVLLKMQRRLFYFVGVVVIVGVFLSLEYTPLFPEKPKPKEGMEMRDGRMPPPDGPRPEWMHGKHHEPPIKPFGNRETMDLLVLVLMLGMNVGVKLYFRAEKREEEMKELQKENLNTQLQYLKYQVNPHFFMNTLNNIHALVDINPEQAKEAIVQLSKMMRYILYEGEHPMVSLSREEQFIRSYLRLMRLRFTDKVDILFDCPDDLPEAQIPPLLLITFIENAFKHGVSYRERCCIHIAINCTDDRLHFACDNSKYKAATEQHGGVGLQNARRRLELIYGDDYTLDINDKEDKYEVKLEIPLKHD